MAASGEGSPSVPARDSETQKCMERPQQATVRAQLAELTGARLRLQHLYRAYRSSGRLRERVDTRIGRKIKGMREKRP